MLSPPILLTLQPLLMTTAGSNPGKGTIFLFLALFFVSGCSRRPQESTGPALAGMYKLVIIEHQDSTGQWQEESWARGGDSYIVYDGLGHMAVQITPKGYKDFNWLSETESINEKVVRRKVEAMSLPELQAAVVEFSSSYVYVADYSIDLPAHVVTHKRVSSSIPSVWGTEVKRSFSFSGDTLILRVLNANRRLKWLRQK